MNYLSPKQVVERLRARPFTEREKCGYLLASLLLVGLGRIGQELGLLVQRSPATLAGLVVVVTLCGVWICFQVNAHGDNREFLSRYICLRLPVGLIVILFLWPTWIAGYLIARRFIDAPTAITTFRSIAPYFAVLTEIIIVAALRVYFKRVVR